MSEDILGIAFRDVRGPLTTLMERLSGQDAAMWLRRLNRFNRGENPFEIPRIIEVTSDGRNERQFISSLERAGYNISSQAKNILQETALVDLEEQTHKLVIIRGKEFDGECLTTNVHAEAEHRGYLIPPVEVAFLLREVISDKELEQMGLLWLIVMHEPIRHGGHLSLFSLNQANKGRNLDVSVYHPNGCWDRRCGFVFLAPQV